jgi:hypothetical protein
MFRIRIRIRIWVQTVELKGKENATKNQDPSHSFSKLDPELDPHEGWIRIRMKSLRIRNTDPKQADIDAVQKSLFLPLLTSRNLQYVTLW